jgi:hypothetical protein
MIAELKSNWIELSSNYYKDKSNIESFFGRHPKNNIQVKIDIIDF